ncbi:aldehyde dehydrogenase family protein [Priestia megaterium]
MKTWLKKQCKQHFLPLIRGKRSAGSTSRYSFRAADIIRRRKHEFSAYLVKEAGKPWKEADADTAEAIDFLEYYARQMVQLKTVRLWRAATVKKINLTTFRLVSALLFHRLTSR